MDRFALENTPKQRMSERLYRALALFMQLQALIAGMLPYFAPSFLNPQIHEDLWAPTSLLAFAASAITYNFVQHVKKPTYAWFPGLAGLLLAVISLLIVLSLAQNILLAQQPYAQYLLAEFGFVGFYVGFGAVTGWCFWRVLCSEITVESQQTLSRQVASLTDAIAGLQVNPLLDNFDGEISVIFYGDDGVALRIVHSSIDRPTVVVEPLGRCVAIVRLEGGHADHANPFRQEIKIVDGINDADTVTFLVAATSDHLTFDPSYQTTAVKAVNEHADLRFDFIAPQKIGSCEIYFEVSQRNRLVQTLLVELTIDRGKA